MASLQGHLLIAAGGLVDPNFRRTIILVVEHNEDGAFGVVLNRPAGVTVAEAAPALASLVGPGEPLFAGGPVQRNAAVVLAELEHPAATTTPVFGAVGLVTGDLEAEELGAVRRARVFAGYAGWSAGQLEDELRLDAWITEPALADDLFSGQSESLWSTVLRRKGPTYAMLSLMPFDPSTN